ncbi:MAG: enhancer of polycomb-like-domain-containing protein [Benjaminiella poitrasii]|nr:MAG: enhancer of polycomb-like-domain-containing protein [Benjaminiella poitrasii]
MTIQMVSRFRVKKLSPKHPLPIYKESQLPELIDPASIQRSVPQIETGVEKEEEEEHDLQAAISAHQAAVTTGAKIETYIPTPDASSTIDRKQYELFYKKKFKEPSTLIRFSSTVEDTSGCPYVMDDLDETFLNKYNTDHTTLSEDDFEKIMYQFESITKEKLPHLHLDISHIPDFKNFMKLVPESSFLHSRAAVLLEPIFNHWRKRKQERSGESIIPELKYEDLVKNEIDPYVCFRRRETKPVRKTRRSDQQSLERLRKLRSEMEMARNLLEMVLRREKIRKESMVLEHTVFDKRCKLREYQKILGIKEDDDLLFQTKKKRKASIGSGATIKIPLHRLKRDAVHVEKSPAQLAIEADLAKKKKLDAPYEDVTECSYQPFPIPLPTQFFQPLSNGIRYRKRIGRGGRIFIDRTGYKRPSTTFGKTKPGANNQPIDKYMFDSDSNNEESDVEIDEMDDSYLKHRTQLLSEMELRSLVTVPFLTPMNMMNIQAVKAKQAATVASNNSAAAAAASSQRLSIATGASSLESNANNSRVSSPNNVSAHPIKKQMSRSRMTPQQAAVAMANGMIAANMAAVVNGSSSQSRTAVQMALAAAQQQRQQQQQRVNMNKEITSPAP